MYVLESQRIPDTDTQSILMEHECLNEFDPVNNTSEVAKKGQT